MVALASVPSLKVPELRSELETRKLSTDGLKKELVARLQDQERIIGALCASLTSLRSARLGM